MILNTLQQNGIRKHPQPQQQDEELRQHKHQEIGLPSLCWLVNMHFQLSSAGIVNIVNHTLIQIVCYA